MRNRWFESRVCRYQPLPDTGRRRSCSEDPSVESSIRRSMLEDAADNRSRDSLCEKYDPDVLKGHICP